MASNPPTPPNPQALSIQQTAEAHADEILARRQASRASRAAALAQHRQTLQLRTEVTRVVHAAATPAQPAGAAAPSGATPPAAAPVPAAAAAVATTTETAGYLVAVGDSWFDYPIHDVLTKLDDNYGYTIESSAHRGDPIEVMVSHVGQLDKFARNLDKVVGVGATPKAILVSGGGDDIAGDEFGMLINDKDSPIAGWNEQIVAGVIDTRIAGSYRLMVASINALCQKDLGRTFPILIHGYDYAVPDGRGFLGGWGPLPGPWLKPGFDEKLFVDPTQTRTMVVWLIDRFNTMLQNLLSEPGFANVRYVNLRGTLSNADADYKTWWANELHPTGDTLFGSRDGFAAVAAKFQAVLATLP